MKHLIMGTAGHIDHGKTSLVKSLTKIDCDTHPEEKLRGITINLGFAHISLPNQMQIGIVDVPGHSDFVNTMISGACGIDFVMFTIAADSGVMPQTIEHLHIMDLLGIKNGFIALTKADLVDEELLVLAKEEIREAVSGTFLQDAPIIPTSVKTEQGLKEVIAEIERISEKIPQRTQGEIFRMYIDRIFTVPGFGSVVTGSVLSGSISTDDTVYLLPGAKELRIRKMERYRKETRQVYSGDRASLNLAGMEKDQFKRGMMLSDRVIQSTTMIDCKLKLFREAHAISLWSQVIFLSGTYQSQAKLHLLDSNKLEPGETALTQVHLAENAVLQTGDPFIIRSSSGDITLGGGVIIDAYPLKHKRRPAKLIRELQNIATGDIPALIMQELKKRMTAISHQEIATILNCSDADILKTISETLSEDIITIPGKEIAYLMLRQEKEKLRGKIIRHLQTFHKRNPLDDGGRSTEELMGIFGLQRDLTNEQVLKLVLAELERENKLKRIRQTWVLAEHNVQLNEEDECQVSFVESFIANCGMQVPLMSRLIPASQKKGISETKLKQILRLLSNKNKVYNIDGNFIWAELVDKCRKKLLEHLAHTKQGITVAEFRDLVDGNRKICLLLLAQYDTEGITVRKGDYRYITEKGRNKLRNLNQGSF